MTHLPALIEEMRLAINAQDFDRFIATFAPNGEVNDWNRSFKGPAHIREWSDTELIGAKGTLTVSKVVSDAGGVTVFDADWASSHYTGPGRFTVTVRGGRIVEMRISEPD